MAKTLKPQRSIAELTSEFDHQIESLILREPALSTDEVAVRAVQEADSSFLAELSARLVGSLAARLARAERAKQPRTQRHQLLLPGFGHLPQRISIADKKRMPLEKATYSDVRAYVRRLSNLHRDRLQNDSKLAEGRALLERMAKYNQKSPGITVKEVFQLETK